MLFFSCFTFKIFSNKPQSTLIYGLLYRQGRKRSVPVLLGSWDFKHRKLILHPLPLFQCWMSTHERLCKRSHQLPSSKISITARKLIFYSTRDPNCFCMVTRHIKFAHGQKTGFKIFILMFFAYRYFKKNGF